ncbi:porin [Rhodoferax sp.]|uniref:porin n=1 Tax=Rhodoferax sp. TaxID=50421 RepID=UPI00284210EB|nr:porin [Rhodoferax sp.]MDR3368275.1 porin [Rhodoferax sp.]
MKKSLIALAVLAASGASFAQSTVSVYGILDAWMGVNKAANGVSTTMVGSGGVDGDRWGLKGSEDLGGGLKADFVLEQGFSIDTGAADTIGATDFGVNGKAGSAVSSAFARYSAVGFSGGFGEVKLGKYSTAYDMVENGANGVFNSALSAEKATWKSGATYNWNPANGIYYATPEMGGFSAAVSYALGENKTSNVGAGNITAFNVKYAQGPIMASLGYQEEKADGNATANKFGQINGSYDFGMAKLQLAYGTADVTAAVQTKTSEYEIGVTAPVSTALAVSANYAYSKDDDNAVATGVKRSGIGLGAAYSLSKRTFVYGGYRAETAKQDGAENVDTHLFAVGVHHVF